MFSEKVSEVFRPRDVFGVFKLGGEGADEVFAMRFATPQLLAIFGTKWP